MGVFAPWLGGVRQILEKRARGELLAELLDGMELDGVEAEFLRGLDVVPVVVDKYGFLRFDGELGAGEAVYGGVGFGDGQFARPGELGKIVEPPEFLAHGAEHFRSHVGEDGGQQAGLLKSGGPGEHRLVDRGPHQHVGFDEVVDLPGREVKSGVMSEFCPVTAPIEKAQIVVMTVAPVETVEGSGIEAGDLQEAAVRSRLLDA